MTASVTEGAAGAGGMELARMLATLAWVVGATAAAVGALGAVPGWITGESGAVRSAPSIQDAERRLGARILVPGYFPERLEWPPQRILVSGGRRGSVRLLIGARRGFGVELLEATREGEAIAPPLLEDRTILRTARTKVGAHPATISDVLVDGRSFRELAWEVQGRAMILRSAGNDIEELFRMAKSAHREGGR
jgi:hypothetical protein